MEDRTSAFEIETGRKLYRDTVQAARFARHELSQTNVGHDQVALAELVLRRCKGACNRELLRVVIDDQTHLVARFPSQTGACPNRHLVRNIPSRGGAAKVRVADQIEPN